MTFRTTIFGSMLLGCLVGCGANLGDPGLDGSEGEPGKTREAISQSTLLRLPFSSNDWWVIIPNTSTHVGINEFALDTERVDAETLNKPILSPAIGTVFKAVQPQSNGSGGYVHIAVSGDCSEPLPATQSQSTCVIWSAVHLETVNVVTGQAVNAGTFIGAAGDTGAFSPHLHMALAHLWGDGVNNYETIPQAFIDYQVETSPGVWDVVAEGTPAADEKYRRIPTWSDWGPASTFTTKGSPSATHSEVYARSDDDEFWARSATGTWSQAASGAIASTPSVVWVTNDNKTRVAFARRASGSTHSLWRSVKGASTWGSWVDLGGQITEAPAAAIFQNRIHVIARGANDDTLWRKILNLDSTFTVFQDWQQITTTAIKSAPAIASNGTYLYAYFRGASDDQIYQIWDDGNGFSSPLGIGGQTNATPSVVAQSDGQVKVFVRGKNDNRLWQRIWYGSFWSSWHTSGADNTFLLSSGPAAVATSNDRVQVFARGSSSTLESKQQML